MYLRQLGLTNFRCYEQLDLTLPCGTVIVAGRNAQGKTSLLEAAYVLATTRSPHARHDRETLRWGAVDDVMPHCRVFGEVCRDGQTDSVEVVGVLESAADGSVRFKKSTRVNNAARRAIDVVGVLNVVLFTPRDIQLVDGAPSERRHYLDVLRCQVDRSYCTALARYNRVLTQRNHLLRRLREHGGDRGELSFWDDELAEHGATVLAQRLRTVEKLDEVASAIHAELADGDAPLAVSYRSSVKPMAGQHAAGGGDGGVEGQEQADSDPRAQIADAFRQALATRRDEEIARGATVVGPHRDDMRFLVDDVDMRVFGSRGQQRTVTLAMKLAEAKLMWHETGERPVLLLDDVLSELDPDRKQGLLAHVDAHQQTLLTTTEPDQLPDAFLRDSTLITVEEANVVETPPERLECAAPSGGEAT